MSVSRIQLSDGYLIVDGLPVEVVDHLENTPPRYGFTYVRQLDGLTARVRPEAVEAVWEISDHRPKK